jgi:hypothetical protein
VLVELTVIDVNATTCGGGWRRFGGLTAILAWVSSAFLTFGLSQGFFPSKRQIIASKAEKSVLFLRRKTIKTPKRTPPGIRTMLQDKIMRTKQKKAAITSMS